MTKDFLIVQPESVCLKTIKNILDSLMENKKIKISKKNYIVIGTNNKIILDVNKKIIKGRIIDDESGDGVEIVNKLVDEMGSERVYMHYYGEDSFVNNKKVEII